MYTIPVSFRLQNLCNGINLIILARSVSDRFIKNKTNISWHTVKRLFLVDDVVKKHSSKHRLRIKMADQTAKVAVMGRYLAITHIIVGVLLFCFGIADYVTQHFWTGYVCFGIWIGIWVSFFATLQSSRFYITGFIYYI